MAGFRETFTVQFESAVLALQESTLSIRKAYHGMAPLKQGLVMFFLIAMIPLYLGVRFGTEKIMAAQYARKALSSHPSYTVTNPPVIGDVKIIKNNNGTFSAYAELENPNLDLSADNISYSIALQNSAGESIYPVSGTTYLLPDEKKFIVVPKIESTENIVRGTLTLGDVDWQKRISIPQVQLKVSEPTLLEEVNPLTFVAEGSVVNNSPYALRSVRLVFFIYDANGRAIGVSQRDEFTIPAFGRRAYKQLWPGHL
jgi:hypothetical protein